MKKSIVVSQEIKVTIDESKFDEAFMEEFRQSFYHFTTIDDHLCHLAQLYARGLVDEFSTFIEGYGPMADMGISFETGFQEEEVARELTTTSEM